MIRPYEFHWVFRFWRSEKAGVTIMPSYLLNNRSGNDYTRILLPQSLSLFGCTRAIRPWSFSRPYRASSGPLMPTTTVLCWRA